MQTVKLPLLLVLITPMAISVNGQKQTAWDFATEVKQVSEHPVFDRLT